MGRRSRKRAAAAGEDASAPTTRAERDAARRERRLAAAPGERPRPSRRRTGERPPAPWGKFPLTELVVLLAIVLGAVGLITWGDRGRLMLACAAVLGSLAGLEISIREHFAGYRSHTTLLAAAAGVATMTILVFALREAPPILLFGVGGLVFGLAFWALRETFKRRSGGLGFR